MHRSSLPYCPRAHHYTDDNCGGDADDVGGYGDDTGGDADDTGGDGGDADGADGGSVYPDAAPLPPSPWVSVSLGVPRSQQQKSRGIIPLTRTWGELFFSQELEGIIPLTRNRVKPAPLVKPSSLTVP